MAILIKFMFNEPKEINCRIPVRCTNCNHTYQPSITKDQDETIVEGLNCPVCDQTELKIDYKVK